MNITTEQLKRIAAAGGGLVIDASTFTFHQIKELATAANSGNAKIQVNRPSELTAVQLHKLAIIAPSLIIFDLTS